MTEKLPPLPNDDLSGDTVQSDPERTVPYTPSPKTPPSMHTPVQGQPPIAVPTPSQPTAPVPRTPPPSSAQVRRAPPPPGSAHVQRAGSPPRQASTTNMRRAAPRPPSQRESALYLPWWSLVLMLLGVLGASFAIVLLIAALGGSAVPATREPIIRIITAVPTLPNNQSESSAPQTAGSEVLLGQNPPSELALQGPTLPAVVFTATPISIAVGKTIEVQGLDGDELNVRDNAGTLSTSILFRAAEGTRFLVVEGPTQADGFTWWRIQNLTNSAQSGWAVANFLRVLEGQ